MPVKGQMKEGRDENREVFIRWKEENDKEKELWNRGWKNGRRMMIKSEKGMEEL